MIPTISRSLVLAAACALAATPHLHAQQDLFGGKGSMEAGGPGYIPWAGVGEKELLTGKNRKSLVVTTSGAVKSMEYPGGLDVLDLTGDGLPDLFLADSNGFFWLYVNQGTKEKPEWPDAELMSLWLVPEPRKEDGSQGGDIWSPTAGYPPACSRIYLKDFTGDGDPDLILGDYLGNVMFLENTGSAGRPFFQSPASGRDIAVPTGPEGRLWGNYLSPVYEDFDGDNKLDLLVGEGTYSANSIWLFPNEGGNERPRFVWDKRQRIIPGMGREHLTPQPVDWNGDGKMDLIVGEREGNLNVYINEMDDTSRKPVFNQDPIVPKFAGSEPFSALACPIPEDVNGDGLFDLLTTDKDNNILLAINTGTKGQPAFGKPTKLTGKNPYPRIKTPNEWKTANPLMSAYYTLRLVGTDSEEPETYEEGLRLPGDNKDKKNKYALKYETVKPMSRKAQGQPKVPEKLMYRVTSKGTVTLKHGKNYTISFYVKGDNIVKSRLWIRGGYTYKNGPGKENKKRRHIWIPKDFSVRPGWTREELTYSFDVPKDAENKEAMEAKAVSFSLDFTFESPGNMYIDDLVVTEGR